MAKDGILLLERLFRPDDFLCLAKDKFGTVVKRCDAWIADLLKNGNPYPFFCINPLTGKAHQNSSGKVSRRCDNAVAGYRYALLEFDKISIEDQLTIWGNVKLPIVTLTFSGNKSIHALISLENSVLNPSDWDRVVKGKLFSGLFSKLGVDPATANPSRLSRFPGHDRTDGQLHGDKAERFQRLFYLKENPNWHAILSEQNAPL
jgi:hypothetical protein